MLTESEIRMLNQKNVETEKQGPVVVTITYSFDSTIIAVLFDDYQSACDFIRNDFEREKKVDLENRWKINEELTHCEEDMAVLANIFPDRTDVTTWQIADVVDKRSFHEDNMEKKRKLINPFITELSKCLYPDGMNVIKEAFCAAFGKEKGIYYFEKNSSKIKKALDKTSYYEEEKGVFTAMSIILQMENIKADKEIVQQFASEFLKRNASLNRYLDLACNIFGITKNEAEKKLKPYYHVIMCCRYIKVTKE